MPEWLPVMLTHHLVDNPNTTVRWKPQMTYTAYHISVIFKLMSEGYMRYIIITLLIRIPPWH